MRRTTQTYGLLALAILVVLTPEADARPRRRGHSYSTSSYSSSPGSIAPKSDPGVAEYRTVQAFYSYDDAMREEVAFTDRVRVYMVVKDEHVLNWDGPLVAEVQVTDLNASQKSQVRYVPVTYSSENIDNHRVAVFDVENQPGEEPLIQPAKIYRLFVNLHRESAEYSAESAWGKVAFPYYVATAGDERLDRARQHIAMRTFKEFYYVQQGWRSGEQYPMDCYAYYVWATGSCTVGAQNGRTILERLFGRRRPYCSGGQIVPLAREGAIHGDYVRIPGHSFMLLAYDADLGRVWTMEGNFNSTIEVVTRSVGSGWTVGHLAEEHVRPDLFQLSHEQLTGSTLLD